MKYSTFKTLLTFSGTFLLVTVVACLVFIFSMAANAQAPALKPGDPNTATVYWANGTATTVHLQPGGGQSLENRYRNTGMSDRWGNHPGGPPQPVFATRITVTAPGKTILDGQDFYGYVPLGNDTWEICGPTDYKYPASRGNSAMTPIAGYEQCANAHTFDGGDLIGYVRLVPVDDPIEQHFLADSITQESANLCAQILSVDEAFIAQWPWLATFATRWTFTASSWSTSTPGDQRNFGWYLRPENFMNRYPNHPGGLASLKHHRGCCTTIPGGSSCNEHEEHLAWYLAQAQRSNDLAALHKCLALARAFAAYGVIINSPADDLYGLARNEAAGKIRGTCGQNPSLAKQFMTGLIALNALLRGSDPLIAEAVTVNGSVMKSQRWQACYHGASGTRMLSHELMVLRAHYVASGDDAFKAKAVSEITQAFTHPQWGVGVNNYWGNVNFAGASNTMCYDEGLNGIVAWWIDQDPALAKFLPKLKEIVQHVLAHCVASNGRVGYKWNPTLQVGTSLSEITGRVLQPLQVVYNGDFNGAWLMAMRPWCEREFPGVYTAKFELMAHYMFTKYAVAPGAPNPNGWQAFDGSQGVSFEKMAGFIMNGTQNWWLN